MYGAKEVIMRSRAGRKWLRLAVGKVLLFVILAVIVVSR